MSHFDDAKLLVRHAKNRISEIKKEYDDSLEKMNVEPSLLVDIKNLMENLRSALDFAAHGLFDAHGHSSKKNLNIYFPYAPLAQSLDEFRRKNRIEICIPGLSSSRPDIVMKLESYQHFTSSENKWLPLFMDLNNENKHQKLTPQVRAEKRQLDITSGGTGITLQDGASISLGNGASIKMGGMTILGGQTITTESPAITTGLGSQTITKWISFYFSTNNEPVVPFLEKAILKVEGIIDELSTI